MSSVPGLAPLKFVTETELDEKRKKRQEEWEKVRQPHQPLEAPEEPVETRSLFEQLQAQKDAKQLEFEEQHKLKNQVHGLDKEEAEFLDFVYDRQQEIEKERQLEEITALQELRSSVAGQSAAADGSSQSTEKVSSTKVATGKKRTSQAELLAGAVKRKRSDEESSTDKQAEVSEEQSSKGAASTASAVDTSVRPAVSDDANRTGVATVVGILPGLGEYTDSEQSDTSSSDSDIDTDLFRRETHAKAGHDPGATAGGAAPKHRHH